jgi:hypothetical protein
VLRSFGQLSMDTGGGPQGHAFALKTIRELLGTPTERQAAAPRLAAHHLIRDGSLTIVLAFVETDRCFATSVFSARRPCASRVGRLDRTMVGDALPDKIKECIKLRFAKLHSQLVDGTPDPQIALWGHNDVMPAFNVHHVFKPG